MNFYNLCLVGLGGAIGSIFRFCISEVMLNFAIKPIGTFFINILGCFFIGILYSYNLNNSYKAFLMAGLAGGFTTFSAFCLENFIFIQNKEYLSSLIYCLCSFVFGIVFLILGFYIRKIYG